MSAIPAAAFLANGTVRGTLLEQEQALALP